MALVQLHRLSAVQTNMFDSWRVGEELVEVIGHHRGADDITVQAGLPGAQAGYIPNRHLLRQQLRYALRVRQGGIKPVDSRHDGPEGVTRMGIILTDNKRCLAGHTAEDQQTCARRAQWCEAVNGRHALLLVLLWESLRVC